MNRCFAALALLLAVVLPTAAQPPKRPVSKEAVLKAIADFRADPDSVDGHQAMAIIIRFAQESPEVMVSGSTKLQPWTAAKPPPKHNWPLLVAYIAGSVRSQLASGKTQDDALAGEEQVFETYEKFQQTTPDLHIPEVEKLLDLKKQGKLEEYLDAK